LSSSTAKFPCRLPLAVQLAFTASSFGFSDTAWAWHQHVLRTQILMSNYITHLARQVGIRDGTVAKTYYCAWHIR